MAVNVLVPIANGSEEMEAVIIIDMLRRAGINVKVAGETDIVRCSRGIKILPDMLIDDLDPDDDYDAIVLPGGAEGAVNLSDNPVITEILEKFRSSGKTIGAICAAPTILDNHHILPQSAKVTSHPTVQSQMGKYSYTEQPVVSDGIFVTSRGAGTAFDFALKLIEIFVGKETSEKVKSAIVYK